MSEEAGPGAEGENRGAALDGKGHEEFKAEDEVRKAMGIKLQHNSKRCAVRRHLHRDVDEHTPCMCLTALGVFFVSRERASRGTICMTMRRNKRALRSGLNIVSWVRLTRATRSCSAPQAGAAWPVPAEG